MMDEVISLMMITYNRLDLTKRTLDSLFKTTDGNFNFVIIDNGSTDGTIEYLKEIPSQYSANFHIHLNPENKGIAIGRNQALKRADELNTEWYCTLDNDVEMPDGWLAECINILKVNKRYGMIGVNMEGVEYPIVTENGKTFQWKPEGNLGTACIVFNKSLHKILGFFNTEYGKYGEEDADYGMRARVVGYQLGYIKEMGNHFGVGDLDTGKYREWKTECHQNNLKQFKANCSGYYNRQKPVYLRYRD